MDTNNVLKRIGIGRRHLQYLLAGERNATPATAKKLERVIGAEKSLWIFGTAKQRRSAWEKFKKAQAKIERGLRVK